RQRQYIRSALAAQAGPGRPLPPAYAADFGFRLGADLSDVRIHDDATAAALADAVGARAFTLGSHVFFNRGEHQPNTQAGHALLAHEIAHVVQQSPGRWDAARDKHPTPISSDQAEAEAASVGRAVVTGSAIAALHFLAGPIVQCAPAGDAQR